MTKYLRIALIALLLASAGLATTFVAAGCEDAELEVDAD